jgi:hypothetical protein
MNHKPNIYDPHIPREKIYCPYGKQANKENGRTGVNKYVLATKDKQGSTDKPMTLDEHLRRITPETAERKNIFMRAN